MFSLSLPQGMFARICRWLKEIALNRWTTRVAMPLIGGLPPTIYAALELKSPWPKWFFDHMRALDQYWPWLNTFVVFLPLVFIPSAFVFERWRDKIESAEKLAEEELATLLRVLERPVGQKRAKLADFLKRLKNNGATVAPDDVVAAINPDEQIRLLVEGIHFAFQADVKHSDDLKVTLARMDGETISDFHCYLPRKSGPRIDLDELKSPDTTFNVAARERRMVIIPDIKKEIARGKKRRYHASSRGKDAGGSLICYPVIHQELGLVPFVIGVKYCEPEHFTADRTRRYEFILGQFAERICLESCVSALIETAHHHRDSKRA